MRNSRSAVGCEGLVLVLGISELVFKDSYWFAVL